MSPEDEVLTARRGKMHGELDPVPPSNRSVLGTGPGPSYESGFPSNSMTLVKESNHFRLAVKRSAMSLRVASICTP